MKLSAAGLVTVCSLSVASIVACTAPFGESFVGSEAPVEHQGAESGAPLPAVSDVRVLTQHNDVGRTGLNGNERVLTTENVTAASFGKVFERAVDGKIFAQPLFVGGGVPGKNVVYVATQANMVYAFDAESPDASEPLWKVSLGTPMPVADAPCPDPAPTIGVTATPVIDMATRTLFVSANTKEDGAYVYRLHALDLATGAAKRPSVKITATVAASGTGSSAGKLAFDPKFHLNRPGLLLSQGRIWLGFGSRCDAPPYHGWVFAYDAATFERRVAWVSTPDGEGGGVWQAGVGFSADDDGNVFFVTGDGSYDGARNLGDSIVKMSPEGAVLTWFTPAAQASMDARDLDMGETGAAFVPGSNLLFTGGKEGIFYVVDRDRMGGLSDDDAQIVQKARMVSHDVWGAPAWWNDSMFVWGRFDHLKRYAWRGTSFDTEPEVNAATRTRSTRGGQLAISANGSRPGTAIVWATHTNAKVGTLAAFDAEDVTRRLWSSEDDPRDALGTHAKFAAPTVANGRVYVATFDDKLVVYGLRPGSPLPDAGSPPIADAGSDASFDFDGGAPTWSELYAEYFGPGTPGHCGNAGCHATARDGFRCGSTAHDCYVGLYNVGMIDIYDPPASYLGDPNASPLAWFGGDMPKDAPFPNPAAAAAIRAWLDAGGQEN